ncbi:MAG: hypothetical protein ACW99F_08340 [Candidatus Hodarchaeales archaeon]|jgi:hypothetical protein
MTLGVLIIAKAALKTMLRQKSIIFSCFILPVFLIWSTWWITAEIPMVFKLENDQNVSSNMIDVHIVTGGLLAVAITAGLFGFILTADSRRLANRLHLMGYPSIIINFGWFAALLTVLLISASVASLLTIYFYEPLSIVGVVSAIFLTTIIYAAFGYFLGILYPRIMEGTLIVLLVSFIDLMLLSNPMGENMYLVSWTKILPGFWSTQMALEAAFIGQSSDLLIQAILIICYILVLLISTQIFRVLKEKKYFNVFNVGVSS